MLHLKKQFVLICYRNLKILLPNRSRSIESCMNARLYVRPCSLIFMFLLSPNQFSVRIFGAFFFYQIEWERRNLQLKKCYYFLLGSHKNIFQFYLFNTTNSNIIFESSLCPGLFEIVVYFSGAENEFFNVARILRSRSTVWDYSSEFGAFQHFIE